MRLSSTQQLRSRSQHAGIVVQRARIVVLGLMLAACGKVGEKHADVDGGPLDTGVDTVICVSAPPGLQSRWAAETSAKDDTGAHNGTGIGNLFGYIPGVHGLAFRLDGSTNLVLIDDGDALWPTGSFSIEAWVQTTSSGMVVSKYQCGNLCPSTMANALWRLRIVSGGAAQFELRVDGSQKIGRA